LPTTLCSRLLACAFAAFVFGCGPLAGPAAARHEPNEHVHRRTARTVGERAAAIALREVGVPYRWGGSSPISGFDCSGLVYYAYARLGIPLPHSSYALFDQGRRIPRSRMRPGDVLFFYGLGHVGIYIGRGRMVHAPHTGTRVQIVKLSRYGAYVEGVRRIRR
jgi:cell wall-associated NlpC family hydrolase